MIIVTFSPLIYIYALKMFILENHLVIFFEIIMAHLYTYIDINKMIYNNNLFLRCCLFSINIC